MAKSRLSKLRCKTRVRANKLRQRLTGSEKLIESRLYKNCIPFISQAPIGPFIADIYLCGQMTILELDGRHHLEGRQKKYDESRDAFIKACGYRVIRINNVDAEIFSLDEWAFKNKPFLDNPIRYMENTRETFRSKQKKCAAEWLKFIDKRNKKPASIRVKRKTSFPIKTFNEALLKGLGK